MTLHKSFKWRIYMYGIQECNMSFVFIYLNRADSVEILSDNSDLASVPIIVYSNGGVLWLAPANFVAQCTITITYYPFDVQTCHLMVKTIVHSLLNNIYLIKLKLNILVLHLCSWLYLQLSWFTDNSTVNRVYFAMVLFSVFVLFRIFI